MSRYVLHNQVSELERLRMQSLVWEPAGRSLLADIPVVKDARALEVGCGVFGWLRILNEWVGSSGSVVGTDVQERMLELAADTVASEKLDRVTLLKDDLFATKLPPASFDLVHARFQIAPLGRAEEQVAIMSRLLKPGGWLVLEDPDSASWRTNPEGPAISELIRLILEAFRSSGGDFDAGRRLPQFVLQLGTKAIVRTHVLALTPQDPYYRLPLQFAESLRPKLLMRKAAEELDDLLARAESELSDPERWGTTFTLVQVAVRMN